MARVLVYFNFAIVFFVFYGCWWYMYGRKPPGFCGNLPHGYHCGLPLLPAVFNVTTWQQILYLFGGDCNAMSLSIHYQDSIFCPLTNNVDVSVMYLGLYFIFMFYFSSRSICMISALAISSWLTFYL